MRQSSYKTLGEPIPGTWTTPDTSSRISLSPAPAWKAAPQPRRRRNALRADLLTILDALEQLEKVADVTNDDVPEDEAFHLAIMRATHNPVIVDVRPAHTTPVPGQEHSVGASNTYGCQRRYIKITYCYARPLFIGHFLSEREQDGDRTDGIHGHEQRDKGQAEITQQIQKQNRTSLLKRSIGYRLNPQVV